jgi:sec-independent protein translocase protein TatB
MDFFNIGGLELIVILVVAFIVLGPERVTDVAQSLGKFARQFREGTQQITRDVMLKEVDRGGKPADQEVPKPPPLPDPNDPTIPRQKGP